MSQYIWHIPIIPNVEKEVLTGPTRTAISRRDATTQAWRSGAHSAAMVGQGRVAAVINDKPVDRCAILEEAAAWRGSMPVVAKPNCG
jgi:hypothetical protein